MQMSIKDLCEKCRDKKLDDKMTFGGFIQGCLNSRGGSFTNPMDYMLCCETVYVNLEDNGGCSDCISRFKSKASGR
jgi:hypothetical protein